MPCTYCQPTIHLSSLKINLQELDRKNLCDLAFVTIDGKDAKDFDDAVFCIKHNDGYDLYVAIADVSLYVKSGSEIDKEALNRGTSIYFPNFVIPMPVSYTHLTLPTKA